MKKQKKEMDTIDLAAYCEGRLAGAEREAFERVLAEDEGECESLALVRRVLQDPEDAGPVPKHLEKKARELYPKGIAMDLVVSLAKGAIEVVRSAFGVDVRIPVGVAPVRNTGAAAYPLVVMTKAFPRARVDLHIDHRATGLCAFTVCASDAAGGRPLEHARVELISGERELASGPLDSGTALFEDIRPGQYGLLFSQDSTAIGTVTITIIHE